ncbi:MAG: aquaporin [Candidatus Solibacter sp.]
MKAIEALRAHWPEYLMEAAALGTFTMSACGFGVLLPLLFKGDFARRLAGGIAMGLTAVAIIYSPWGKRSGAQMNPALTFAYFTLGRIAAWDAVFYIAAQIAGGTAGAVLAGRVFGPAVAEVHYVATTPGPEGPWIALAAEFAIAFLLVSVVLRVANSRRWSKFTPWVAGCLIATFITFESPLSGMSMNPARSFASALPSGIWTAFWLYVAAPTFAMLAAARLYRSGPVFCIKYHHHNNQRCIFRCNYGALQNER